MFSGTIILTKTNYNSFKYRWVNNKTCLVKMAGWVNNKACLVKMAGNWPRSFLQNYSLWIRVCMPTRMKAKICVYMVNEVHTPKTIEVSN